MKKIVIGLMLVATTFMLVACGSKDKSEEVNKVKAEIIPIDEAKSVDETGDDEIYVGMDMSVPWVDSDKAGVLEATGFDIVAPAGATNVAYSYMPSTGMAQMNCTMDNAMWVYRAKHADALEDISEIVCDWLYVGECKVAGMDAMEYSYASEPEGDFIDDMECVRVLNWYDSQNKVTYSLAVLGNDLNGMDTAAYAESVFSPTATGTGAAVGTDDADSYRETDLYQSYLGLHVSGYDGSDIMVEEDEEDGMLKVDVGIFRLCTIDGGVGTYENGVVNFSAIDPNGNPIKCCLFYDSDNSLSLKIEDSTWDYLPTGTVISGFDS